MTAGRASTKKVEGSKNNNGWKQLVQWGSLLVVVAGAFFTLQSRAENNERRIDRTVPRVDQNTTRSITNERDIGNQNKKLDRIEDKLDRIWEKLK